MREEEIRTFVAHYERLTRHLLRELPERADVVLQLTPDRRIERVTIAPR
jgi:D-glycerate 3-kinase